MTVFSADMVTGDRIPLNLTHPKHMAPGGQFLTEKTGGGTFEEVMLQSLDKVSGDQQFASSLEERAITDPDSVDVQDITIAQAKATMSLELTRTILSRLTQAWKDIINVR
jgi:flagellar hook-basal body complex protein FliE